MVDKSGTGERQKLTPEVVPLMLRGQSDLLLKNILSLPTEQREKLLQNLQEQVAKALETTTQKVVTPEVETRSDKEIFSDLVAALRKEIGTEEMNLHIWEKSLAQGREKAESTWNAIYNVAHFIRLHQDLLSENFKEDYGKDFQELTRSVSGFVGWDTKGESQMLQDYLHEHRIRREAIRLCQFALDPLNHPEEQTVATHFTEAITRMERTTRADTRVVKPAGSTHTIERYSEAQHEVDQKVAEMNKLLEQLTRKLSRTDVYHSLKLGKVHTDSELELLNSYIKDLQAALEAKYIYEYVTDQVERNQTRLAKWTGREPDRKDLEEWVNRNTDKNFQIITAQVAEGILFKANAQKFREICLIYDDGANKQRIEGISRKQLSELKSVAYSLKKEVGELMNKEADLQKIPLVVDVQGYYYKADRATLGQMKIEDDQRTGADTVRANLDTFASKLSTMANEQIWWRDVFRRDKKAGMNAFTKMAFIGSSIQDDNIASSDIVGGGMYQSRQSWYRDVRPPEEEDGSYKLTREKAIGFLLGRKIAKQSRTYVPPNFARNFIETGMDRYEDKKVEELIAIAEELYIAWEKHNTPETTKS